MRLTQRLRELYEEATHGEWHLGCHGNRIQVASDARKSDPPIILMAGFDNPIRTYAKHRANAELIAELHNALPKLLEIIDALESTLEEVYEIEPMPLIKEAQQKVKEIEEGVIDAP